MPISIVADFEIIHIQQCDTLRADGFADDLLFAEKEEPAPEPESYAFSRRAVTNRLLNKLPHTKTEQKQPAEPLYQRLNLLKF